MARAAGCGDCASEGSKVTPDELRSHLTRSFQAWQLPDIFLFVPELPHTSVGKILKIKVHEILASHATQTEETY